MVQILEALTTCTWHRTYQTCFSMNNYRQGTIPIGVVETIPLPHSVPSRSNHFHALLGGIPVPPPWPRFYLPLSHVNGVAHLLWPLAVPCDSRCGVAAGRIIERINEKHAMHILIICAPFLMKNMSCISFPSIVTLS